MAKFEIGKKYYAVWPGDADLRTTYTVTKRTAKTVTIVDENNVSKNRRIQSSNDGEYFLPEGSYSLCPVVRAVREVA